MGKEDIKDNLKQVFKDSGVRTGHQCQYCGQDEITDILGHDGVNGECVIEHVCCGEITKYSREGDKER